MCGIIGNLKKSKSINQFEFEYFSNLTNLMTKRGPDKKQFFLSDNKKIYLGHLRLSIIDLSNNANQPMISHDGRFIVTFNGEIYNFRDLSNKLTHIDRIKLKSDTKVLVEYMSKFGVYKTLKDINGMFAISVYDKQDNKLYLARDYFGKKPIYYHHDNENFFFSSTLSPITQNKNIPKKIDIKNLNYYFNYGFFLDGHSIFEKVYKVPKNSILELNLNNWNLEIVRIHPNENQVTEPSPNLKTLEDIIFDSVEKRLISDVPACILLSSGIDSSLVTYYASINNKNVQTFTVGFEDKYYDESKDSKKIAKHFGLYNETIYLKNYELKKIVQEIPEAFDEPFADSSQIPSMLIFKTLSKYAKVCLTGDGGDEIFYGYNRYQWYLIWEKFFKKNILINNSSKIILQKLINTLSSTYIGKKTLDKFNITTNKSEKFLNIFFKKENIYHDFLKLSYHTNFVNLFNQSDKTPKVELNNISDLRNYDINNYLVDDILTKVDRSSMHYSIEARSPLLDRKIFNYVKNFKYQENIKIFDKKILLKKILYKKIPKNILSKSKRGFAVPLEKLIFENYKSEFAHYIEIAKKDERLINLNLNLFDSLINRFFIFKDYKLSYQIWSFYVFFIWFEKNKKYINS